MVMTVVGDVGARIMEYGPAGRNIFWQDLAFFGATLRQKGAFSHPGGSQFDLLDEHGNGISEKETDFWIGQYDVKVETSTRLTAASPIGANTGLQIVRDIEADPVTGEATVRQTVFNRSKQRRKVSVWDRTWTMGPCLLAVPVETNAVLPEGWGFLSLKDGKWGAKPASGNPEAARQFQYKDGLLVIEPAGKTCQILMRSAKGWFAYASGDLMYLKQYAIGPGEYPWKNFPASVWVSEQGWKKVGLMAEMEPMGPLHDLEPGQSCSFQEKWRLIKLKSSVENVEQFRKALKLHLP